MAFPWEYKDHEPHTLYLRNLQGCPSKTLLLRFFSKVPVCQRPFVQARCISSQLSSKLSEYTNIDGHLFSDGYSPRKGKTEQTSNTFCSLHLEDCLWHGRWCSPCSDRAADTGAQHFQPASWVSSPFLCPFPMPPPTLGFGYVQLFGNLKLRRYKFDLNLTLYPSILSQIITVCQKSTSLPFLPKILKHFFSV